MNPTNCLVLLLLLLLALAFAEENVVGSIQSTVSSAKAAVPIHIASNGHNGQTDSREAIAAHPREARLEGSKVIQNAKAYIPPGLGQYLKKELLKLAMKEGSRFSIKHPRETADILSIAAKVNNLYKLVVSKLKKGRS